MLNKQQQTSMLTSSNLRLTLALTILILIINSPTASATLALNQSCEGVNGYIGEPVNCQLYGQCLNGTIVRLLRCPVGLYFDSSKQLCTVNLPLNCSTDQLEADQIELKSITINGTNGGPSAFTNSSSPSPTPTQQSTSDYKIVCYFTNWAWSSPDYGSLYPEDVLPHLCTHINFAFAVLDANTFTLTSSNKTVDYNMNFYRRVTDLKQINPSLKVLLSIGGWGDSADGYKYSQLVNNVTKRTQFIETVVPFLKSNGFDGLDLDWEYPTCWQNICNFTAGRDDKHGFVSLINELRSATINGSDFLITAAVGADVKLVNTSYDVAGLAQSLDFVNLMTYDLYNGYKNVSVHHSQLFPIITANSTSDDDQDEMNRNCNATVTKWLNEGFPASKLILGVPFYGRAFTLASDVSNASSNYGLGDRSLGPGLPGPVTREPGYLSFTEICKSIRDSGWSVERFAGSEAPIAFKGNQWVGFDDLISLQRKASYIKQLKLGGAMLWELSLDDFQGTCCSDTWPLLKTLNNQLIGLPDNKSINCFDR